MSFAVDPFLAFRLFLFVWVLGHVAANVRHLLEDLRSLRGFLKALSDIDPRLGATGERVFRWSLARGLRLAFRHGWPSLVLLALVAAVNVTAWRLLAT
jgi:hypothetical protein